MRHPRRTDRPARRTRPRRVSLSHIAAAALVLFIAASVLGAGQWTGLNSCMAAAAVVLVFAEPLRRYSRRRSARPPRQSRGRRWLRLRRTEGRRAERHHAQHRAAPVDAPTAADAGRTDADLVGGQR